MRKRQRGQCEQQQQPASALKLCMALAKHRVPLHHLYAIATEQLLYSIWYTEHSQSQSNAELIYNKPLNLLADMA